MKFYVYLLLILPPSAPAATLHEQYVSSQACEEARIDMWLKQPKVATKCYQLPVSYDPKLPKPAVKAARAPAQPESAPAK